MEILYDGLNTKRRHLHAARIVSEVPIKIVALVGGYALQRTTPLRLEGQSNTNDTHGYPHGRADIDRNSREIGVRPDQTCHEATRSQQRRRVARRQASHWRRERFGCEGIPEIH